MRRFRHEAQEAATTAAAKIATHRSGARGFDARKVLVEAEAQVLSTALRTCLENLPCHLEVMCCRTSFYWGL